MNKVYVGLLLIGSIVAAIAGIVIFLILFIPDFNIYWLILAPVIIACYEAPAALLYWLYKRQKQKLSGDTEDNQQEPE
jgi:hypothetical protein